MRRNRSNVKPNQPKRQSADVSVRAAAHQSTFGYHVEIDLDEVYLPESHPDMEFFAEEKIRS